MLFVGTYFVQSEQDKISGKDAFQICQSFDKHARQIIICQHHIPVVADGDGRGDNPCAVYVLLLHPVQPRCDAGQGLSASLFPLQQRIAFLESKVDIVLLDFIQSDLFHTRRVPQRKIIQPLGDGRVFIHFRIGHVLGFIFCPFPAEKPLITGIGFRGVFKDCLIDWHRQTFTVFDLPAGCRTVSFIGKLSFALDEADGVRFRYGILLF